MAFESERYHLICHEENKMLVGFISYGFMIMEKFKSATDKILILEIDKISDAQSSARLRFYKKCGFFEISKKRKIFSNEFLRGLLAKILLLHCGWGLFKKISYAH